MNTPRDDNNTFVLFINDKGDNPKRPDRTGTATINGVKYRLAGWIRNGPKGKFLSGSIKPDDQPRQQPAAKELPPEPYDDGIPPF